MGAALRPTLCCVALYLVCSLAYGCVWEPAHDEGTTWGQAIWPVRIAPAPADPVPVSDLNAWIDGRAPHSARDVVRELQRGDSMHPPAYYLLLHGWTRLAGTTRPALSLPAYLFGVLSLLGVRKLAARLVVARGAGTWAMLLFAVSPWFAGYSNLARPYAMAVCLAIWSTHAALCMAAKRGAFRPALAFASLSALGLYTLYHYAFLLAWQLLLLAILAWRRPAPWPGPSPVALGLAVAGIALSFAPWLPVLLAHLELTGSPHWYFRGAVGLADWPAGVAHLLRVFGLAEGLRAFGAGWLRWAFAGLGLCTGALLLWAFRPAARSRMDPAARVFWASTPLLPLLIAAADRWSDAHTLFISKTAFGLFPLLVLGVVHAFGGVRTRAVRVGGLAAWTLLLLTATAATVYTRSVFLNPYERVARYVGDRDRASHLVVVSSINRGYLVPFLLTLRDTGVENARLAYAPSEELVGLVERALAGGGAEWVSLVNFEMYGRESARWSDALLERTAARARRLGWKARRRDPAALGGRRVANARTLLVVSPVEVNYWAM